jgi:ferredoxin
MGASYTPGGSPWLIGIIAEALGAGRTLAFASLAMATHITDACINCGACVPECPNEAISEGDGVYVIDSTLCTECVGFNEKEACQAVCPVECCVPDPSRQEKEETLLARAVALHPDDAELGARVAAGAFPSRFRAA